MTARQHYTLSCDAESCGAQFSCMSRRADATRAAARAEHGWTHGTTPQPNFGGPHRSVDYCPEHASLAAGLTPKALPIHARPMADAEAPVEISSAPDELTPAVMADVAGRLSDGQDDWHDLWNGDPRMPRDR